MSDVKKIATRESYGNALAELGNEHKDIVVLFTAAFASTSSEGLITTIPGIVRIRAISS